MKAAVILFPGSNREGDAARALRQATGRQPDILWHADHDLPAGTDLVVLPGGRSLQELRAALAEAEAFDVRGDDAIAVAIERDRARIPADGDLAEQSTVAAIVGIDRDARPIAEQRAAGAQRGWIDGDDADRLATAAPKTDQGIGQRRLADAGRPGQARNMRLRVGGGCVQQGGEVFRAARGLDQRQRSSQRALAASAERVEGRNAHCARHVPCTPGPNPCSASM